MNPVLHAAAASADFGWLMGLTTALFLGVFIGWTWWAWSPRNRKALDDASRLPLENGGDE